MRESPFAGMGASSDFMGVVRWLARWFLSACVVIAAVGCSSIFASADSTSEKNVLVLYSFSAKDAFLQLEPLKTTVRSRVKGPVNFNVEYLESQRFRSEERVGSLQLLGKGRLSPTGTAEDNRAISGQGTRKLQRRVSRIPALPIGRACWFFTASRQRTPFSNWNR